jgi:hypothetical protein
MPSKFGWVDFAEEDRQRMLEVVRLFGEPGMLDEMGIGTVRDAFADHFFPGTSTIQTRAKYFLFIPWIYRKLEKERTGSGKIAEKLRSCELSLIRALQKSEDTAGLIGGYAGKQLQRMPSSIYWNGLGVWGIRQFRGSQNEYHRSMDAFHCQGHTADLSAVSTGEYEGDQRSVETNWHPGLPEVPNGFPRKAEFALTYQQAEYLAERIKLTCSQSLLSKLLTDGREYDCDFIWEHPAAHNIPTDLKESLTHGQNFSECILGANLLYNRMLADKRGDEELIERYDGRLADWAAMLNGRRGELVHWQSHIGAFWTCDALRPARIRPATRQFINDWLELVFERGADALPADAQAHSLIRRREFSLKRSRARLHNPRALERWRGESGTQQLSFRWPNARRIVSDILASLKEQI